MPEGMHTSILTNFFSLVFSRCASFCSVVKRAAQSCFNVSYIIPYLSDIMLTVWSNPGDTLFTRIFGATIVARPLIMCN